MGRDNGSLNTLKPQPGQSDQFHAHNHPLPGPWAQEQMGKNSYVSERSSQTTNGSKISESTTDLKRALAAEEQRHAYWEKWQGVQPGTPVYEDPRAFQNTLLPVAKFGTDGRGD